MMKKLLLLLCLSPFTLLAQEINIAVAANVSYAIEELVTLFEKQHPETKVRVTLGSSGKLTAQISNGAPYDLFMSANMAYPQALYDANLSQTPPESYAQGQLALFSGKAQDVNISLALLQNREIKRIAIANPKTAPYGKATQELLENAHLYKELKPKFVYGESIAQTISYTITATDFGIIAASALYSKQMSAYKKDVNWVLLDNTLYTPIKQGMILLHPSAESTEFYQFILSSEAQSIFKSYGYLGL